MFSNYCYAANSPLIIVDKDGNFLGTVIGAVTGGVVAAIKGENIWRGAAAGAIAGAAADIIILTAGTGTLAIVAAGAVSGFVGSVADQTICQRKTLNQISLKEVAVSAGLGAGLGYVGAKLAGPISKGLGKLFGRSNSRIEIGQISMQFEENTENTLSTKIAPEVVDELAVNSDNLVKNAQIRYPNKAGKIELHHPIPQYLGGAKNQSLVPLDAAYHQQITNAFRAEWGYGIGKPSAAQLDAIMKKVYSQFPLPK
jgi:hypothetical protein